MMMAPTKAKNSKSLGEKHVERGVWVKECSKAESVCK